MKLIVKFDHHFNGIQCERYEGGYIVQMGITRERLIQTRDEINEMLAQEDTKNG